MPSCDLSEWSSRIYQSVNSMESGTTSSGQILTWLQYNTHKLNAAFTTTYTLLSGCIEPTISSNLSGVYEEMYYCDYYNRRSIQTLGIAAFDLVETEIQDQTRQRFVSRNERAKTYRSITKDCTERLNQLIKWTEDNESTGPLMGQVLFSDRNNMVFGDNMTCPPYNYWSPNNTVFSKFYTFT